MDQQATIAQIKEQIAKNDFKVAFKILQQLFAGSNHESEIFLQMGRLTHLEEQKRQGVLSFDQENIEYNKIRVALLSLLEHVKKDGDEFKLKEAANNPTIVNNIIGGKNIVTGNINAGGNVTIGDNNNTDGRK